MGASVHCPPSTVNCILIGMPNEKEREHDRGPWKSDQLGLFSPRKDIASAEVAAELRDGPVSFSPAQEKKVRALRSAHAANTSVPFLPGPDDGVIAEGEVRIESPAVTELPTPLTAKGIVLYECGVARVDGPVTAEEIAVQGSPGFRGFAAPVRCTEMLVYGCPRMELLHEDSRIGLLRLDPAERLSAAFLERVRALHERGAIGTVRHMPLPYRGKTRKDQD